MLKLKKIKPMFNNILTTMEKYEEDVMSMGIITKKQGGLKEYQRVVEVGSSVRDVKEGDLVCINPKRFAVRKHQDGSLKDGVITDNPITTYNFDVIELDGVQYLLLQDRDIDFIITESEEVPEPVTSEIIKPSNKVIV
jgi:co-chaperonin GroES (HSP10)